MESQVEIIDTIRFDDVKRLVKNFCKERSLNDDTKNAILRGIVERLTPDPRLCHNIVMTPAGPQATPIKHTQIAYETSAVIKFLNECCNT